MSRMAGLFQYSPLTYLTHALEHLVVKQLLHLTVRVGQDVVGYVNLAKVNFMLWGVGTAVVTWRRCVFFRVRVRFIHLSLSLVFINAPIAVSDHLLIGLHLKTHEDWNQDISQ